jgi:hypothetical protein
VQRWTFTTGCKRACENSAVNCSGCGNGGQ